MASATMDIEVKVFRKWITEWTITVAQFLPQSWRMPLAIWGVSQSRPKWRIGDGPWRSMGKIDIRGFDPDTGELVTYINPPDKTGEERSDE